MDKINVTRSSMPDFEEYCREIRDLWDSRWLTNMGDKHKALEAALQEYLGVSHITLFTNGHLALENILEAMHLPKGSRIITTPFTFASTTHAIVRCGFTPVFCDIDPHDFTLDPARLETLITPDTSAILPVHVYGNICHAEAIEAIARTRGLKVIYDAAHAFGVRYKGAGVGTLGDASMFSFHATKVFHTIEGGAVCYGDGNLEQVLNDLKNFGIHGPETVPFVGGNAKMNEFCAAMGLCNLRHITEEIEKRKQAVLRYRQNLSGIPGLRLNPEQPDVTPNYAYFPVLFENFRYTRDQVWERLQQQGIYARKYFYPLTNSFDCYRGRPGFDPSATPEAAHAAETVLTLPLYAGLSPEEVDRVCQCILN